MNRTHLMTSAAALIACGFAVTAQAQSNTLAETAASAPQDGNGIQDIVVTAQRRAESVQKTPVTVTAINTEIIERRLVLAAGDLPSIAPGLSVGEQSGFARIFLRGVGSGSTSTGQDASVAMHIDGVVIGRPFAQLAGFFDVERVEVLRGPQGTLYGRNATGGAINLITRSPTREFGGYINALYGNYNHLQIEGAVNVPVDKSGNIRTRIAFQKITHDGYGRNITLNQEINDRDSWAVRGIIEIDPTPAVDIRITGDYAKEDDRNYTVSAFGPYRSDTPLAGVALGGVSLTNSRDVASDVSVYNKRKFWGLNATVGIDLGGGFRLQSITGYRDSQRSNLLDVDTSSTAVAPILITEDAEQFSQELQMLYSSDRLQGIVGLFYYDESAYALQQLDFVAAGRAFNFPNAVFRPEGNLNVKAKAVFTQWTYEIVDDLRLTAGLRYSDEKRDTNGTFTIFNFNFAAPANSVLPVVRKGNWDALTPRVSIDYTPVRDVMLYASASRGFKSGVLLIGSLNAPVDPEYIWSYEAGVKSTLFDRRLQLNAAGFYYDFRNLQVNRIVNNTVITENAASASIKGFEVEIHARPVRGLSLDGNMTYLAATYGSYKTSHPARPELGELQLSGKRLPNAPKWAFNVGGEVDLPVGLPGRLSLRGDVAFTDRVYFTEFNEAALSQKKYATVDASLQFETEDKIWQASLFAKNLTDKDVRTNVLIAAAATGFAKLGGYTPPRTYGVRVGYRF